MQKNLDEVEEMVKDSMAIAAAETKLPFKLFNHPPYCHLIETVVKCAKKRWEVFI